MANTKSAIKRVRRISRQTIVNKTRKSRFKNAIKKMNSLLDTKKKKEALAFLNLLFLVLLTAVCLDILLILLIADFVFAIGQVI